VEVKPADKPPLPAAAAALLHELQQGKSIAVPSVYSHSMAFSDHALLYADNAVALCRPDGMGDFRIFAALYSLRHGLELWFKCLLRNQEIDRFLAHVFRHTDQSFSEVCEARGLSRSERIPFQRSLCSLRNIFEDGMRFPDSNPWSKRMEERWANKALVLLRGRPELNRSRFALSCQVRLPGHSLAALWAEAEHLVRSFHPSGGSYDPWLDVPPPEVAPDEFAALVELLHHYDQDGDAFRYPSSLDGSWHHGLPHFGLKPLGELASRLTSTIRSVMEIRRVAYEHATISRPSPFDHLIVL